MLINGHAYNIIVDLFNDIHEVFYGWTVSNVSSEPRLATVCFTSTDGMQSHSATARIIVNMLLMIFMTHLKLFSMALTGVAVSTVLDRGLALSSDLARHYPSISTPDFRSYKLPGRLRNIYGRYGSGSGFSLATSLW